MLRSMYSGISGMKVNQTKLDVIGNNIANVGTTGFKSSKVRFQDMLSQNVKDAMAPSMNQGGVNSKQVGLGVQLASIDTVMTQGNLQPTGRNLDLAIDGDGFFMVSKGPSTYGDNVLDVSHQAGSHGITEQSMSSSGAQVMFSRDGSFILDQEGNLLTSDGYRVLGYSLTNDNNGVAATGQKPDMVSTAGLDFRFGPGSQLNGYKVVLGKIGEGTVTNATVDKKEKLVVLDGDFSKNSSLSSEQVESAINKGLSSGGISQRIEVSGKISKFEGIGTANRVAGGSDATAPGSVSLMGVTFKFSEGTELNGYSIELGQVSKNPASATVDINTKKITVDGDFITKGSMTSDNIQNIINNELGAKKIKQTIVGVTGSPSALSQLQGTSDNAGTDAVANSQLAVGGLTFDFSEGAALNGYSITFNPDTTNNDPVITVDKGTKNIVIGGKFTDAAFVGKIEAALQQKLSNNAITSPKVTVGGAYDAAQPSTGKVGTIGQDLKSGGAVNIGGMAITLPKGKDFNGYTIQVTDIKNPVLGVGVDPTKKLITVSGDFVTPNGVTAADLLDKLNTALQTAIPALATATPVNVATISGSPKVVTGVASSMIDGGTELKTPGLQEAFGFNFECTPGASLNGYNISIGKVTAGTKAGVTIDDQNKTILVNGDFASGALTSTMVQSLLNQALQEKGINQGIKVTGKQAQLSGLASDEATGGSPVQSLQADGTVNFIDGTKNLKAYDGSLKTLKIPDKVKIPGTDTYLKVKSYNIDKSGVVNAILEDGSAAAVGQLAMASFKNPEGLSKLGGNIYNQSSNSGAPNIKTGIGTTSVDDNSKGFGSTVQGMLEMSNVDLAEQFTDMIVTNRAFQASGKMITTGDEVLQDIINLKR